MIITRKSQFSDEVHSLEIDATEEQFNNWRNGMVIQKAFPNLSIEEREFILTGTTAEEWDALLVDDFDEDSEDGEWPF